MSGCFYFQFLTVANSLTCHSLTQVFYSVVCVFHMHAVYYILVLFISFIDHSLQGGY